MLIQTPISKNLVQLLFGFLLLGAKSCGWRHSSLVVFFVPYTTSKLDKLVYEALLPDVSLRFPHVS